MEFLDALQHAHDCSHDMDDFRLHMTTVAETYGLEMPT